MDGSGLTWIWNKVSMKMADIPQDFLSQISLLSVFNSKLLKEIKPGEFPPRI